MSSSPTARTSTTASSSNSPFPADRRDRVAVVACGAIAQPLAEIAERTGWPVDVHPLPPLLHNRPERIAGEVEALARELAPHYRAVAVGYADCGTYGALDDVCTRLGLARLAGLHCYDVFAGPSRVTELMDEQPGTYLLTDFLVRSFARTVEQELGLNRHPELREAYFGNYTRVVWLAQHPSDELQALAEDAAARIGLPLEVITTREAPLEHALTDLLSRVGSVARPRSRPPG